jgi:hypothetical protein
MEVPELPRLLYAGNSLLRDRVAKAVNGQVELHVTDNVRPTLYDENLSGSTDELDALYVQDKMGRLPGVEAVRRWSPVPLTPTARAFGRLMQYIWHLGDSSKGVLGVDVGAGNTTLAAVFGGQLWLTVRTDMGVAFSGEQVLEARGADALMRWLPEPVSLSHVHALFANRKMRPISIPQVPQELWLEQALTRELIRGALETARPGWKPGAAQAYEGLLPMCDTIVVSGGVLAHAPRPGQAALIVLDSLEPVGVTTIVLDPHGLAPALGNVAAVKPLAAVEALDAGCLLNLATTVAPVGRARIGDAVLSVRVTFEDGRTLGAQVRYGDLEVLPLRPDQEAIVELRPLRRFDVGLGGPGKGGKRRVSGGLAGLIIDARGRPLAAARELKPRQAKIRQWLLDVGG